MFDERIEEICAHCPGHDIKVLLEDFNAKIRMKSAFMLIIDNSSLHANTFVNAMRLIDLAEAKIIVIGGTKFQYEDIHNSAWVSSDQWTENQIGRTSDSRR